MRGQRRLKPIFVHFVHYLGRFIWLPRIMVIIQYGFLSGLFWGIIFQKLISFSFLGFMPGEDGGKGGLYS